MAKRVKVDVDGQPEELLREIDEATMDVTEHNVQPPPTFTVAPPPPNTIPVPDKESAIARFRKKTGFGTTPEPERVSPPPRGKGKTSAKSEPVLPSPGLSEDKLKFVDGTSGLLSEVMVAVMVWIFTIPGGEFSVLAPGYEEARAIIEPLLRIYARHSKLVKEISPDYTDLAAAITALAGYVHVSYLLLDNIRKDKEANGGQVTLQHIRPDYRTNGEYSGESRGYTTESQAGPGYNNNGRTPVHEPAEVYNEPAKGRGYAAPKPPDDLTPEQRRNYESLQRLSQRDYENRARRSGRL